MTYKILFVFGLISMIRARPVELKCGPRYEQLNNKCYYFSDFIETLESAKNFCNNYHGKIVEINSDEELNMLKIVSKFERFWISINNNTEYKLYSKNNHFNPTFPNVHFICEGNK